MNTTELCTIEVDGTNLELAPPVSGELVEPLWKLWRRMPAYIPDGVNKAQWMTAAASAANSWFNAARRSSQSKNVQIDFGSLAKCVFNASVIGLPMVDQLGYQHLVPMHVNKTQNGGWIECQLWTGYKGYIELARDAGVIDVITPEIVWRDEPFSRWNDETGAHFRHEPSLERPDKIDIKEIKAAYVVTTTPRGHHDFEIVTGSTLRGLARRGNVWASNPVEMAKKSPVRRIAKRWPQTDRMAAAMRLDEQADAEQTQSALVSYQGNGVSAAVVEKTTAEVPVWTKELKAELAKCKTKADVETLRARYDEQDHDLVNQVCDGFLEAGGLTKSKEKPAGPPESPPAAETDPEPQSIDDVNAMLAGGPAPSGKPPAKPKAKRGRPRKKAEPKPQAPTPEKSPEDIEAAPTDAEIIDRCEADLEACTNEDEIKAIVTQYGDLFPEKKSTVELLSSIALRKLARNPKAAENPAAKKTKTKPPEPPKTIADPVESETINMDDMSRWSKGQIEKALRNELSKCDKPRDVQQLMRRYLKEGPADENVIEFIYDACEQREDDLAWQESVGK